MVALRNALIIAAIAAAVAFIPGGGDTAAVIGGVLSTLILVALVWLVARLYRDRRDDILLLGDRWRLVLYGAVAVAVVTLAATGRLWDSSGGTLVWIVVLCGCVYALYLVWRRHREYG